MANEAVLVLRTKDPIDFTVADGAAITKGGVLKMTTPRTAIISSGLGDMCAGIAAADKIASDGRTQLAVFREGVFRMYACGAISAGQHVLSAASTSPNYVKFVGGAAGMAYSGAAILGYAIADIADKAAGEVYICVGLGGAG
jgi:hypothetical protein